ncbi:unnamed protein product, partial [Laminaria digitata]
AECATGAAKAVRSVRYLEGAVTAAERAYAERAGDLVRLRAAVALRERHGGGGVVGGSHEEARAEEARVGEVRFGEARVEAARFGQARVGAARFREARFGETPVGEARAGATF